MSHRELIDELNKRREKALLMGGKEKLEKRRAEGTLNARERLDYLLDKDSFNESGLLATSARPEKRDRSPADGKVAGFGRIGGRGVGIISNDFTVMGASSAQINGKKMKHVKDVCNRHGMPIVYLNESSGARMPDRMGAEGRAILAQDPHEYRRLRETPWVCGVLGPSFGSGTWYTCMSDFAVIRKGATLAVASPRVTSIAIRQNIDPEELGGWKLHTQITGLIDYATDTDEEALDLLRKFLDYMPSHNREAPPVREVPEGSDEPCRNILDLVPAERTKVYDMRKVVAAIADKDSVFEVKPRFARVVTTALARINGRVVGFVGNNPMYKGGAVDPDGCRKVTSFLVLCDSFNIPIVKLVDVPGFLIGVEGERKGAPGKIINWMNALSLCTVPKISVILRKSYGQAYLNMGGGRNSDEVAIWPTADLGFMDPHVSVNVIFGINREDDPELFDKRMKELQRDTKPWPLAELYETHTVLDPRETRDWLKDTLAIYSMRMTNGVGEHLMRSWPTTI
ncbi:MAG: carboxyl transferase domain-containing protein [Acetobacterales bacterium]